MVFHIATDFWRFREQVRNYLPFLEGYQFILMSLFVDNLILLPNFKSQLHFLVECKISVNKALPSLYKLWESYFLFPIYKL